MSELLDVARMRRSIVESEATEIDDFALTIELFLQGAQRNRDLVGGELEHVDEFILYAEYMLKVVTEKLEVILQQTRKLDEFISYGELLLRDGPDVEPDYVAHRDVDTEPGDENADNSEPEHSWLSDLVRHAHEQGARAALKSRRLQVIHPFRLDE